MSILEEIKVNRAPSHMVRSAGLTLSREARQSMGKYTARTKLPGEALKRNSDWRKSQPYKTGDGDHTAQVLRAGSMDAYALPSKGNRT